jgi:hypothetical protein
MAPAHIGNRMSVAKRREARDLVRPSSGGSIVPFDLKSLQ